MIVVSIDRKTRERTVVEAYDHPNDISTDALAKLLAQVVVWQKEGEATS